MFRCSGTKTEKKKEIENEKQQAWALVGTGLRKSHPEQIPSNNASDNPADFLNELILPIHTTSTMGCDISTRARSSPN